MKVSIVNKIKNLINYIFNFRKIILFRGFQKSIGKAITNQEIDKIIAKDIIVKDIRKALRFDAQSKYIPDEFKNREEIRLMINLRHGEKMKFLNIELTEDLKLV